MCRHPIPPSECLPALRPFPWVLLVLLRGLTCFQEGLWGGGDSALLRACGGQCGGTCHPSGRLAFSVGPTGGSKSPHVPPAFGLLGHGSLPSRLN